MTTTSVRTEPWRVGDPARQAVIDAVLAGGHHVVFGAPGTGRSTTAVELLAALAALAAATDGPAALEDVLLLAPTRRAAARLRDAVARRLPQTLGRVVVRTAASFAFSVLRQRAALLGEPPPMMLTGADQDATLADLLAGHACGEGRDPGWPADVPAEALGLATFRHELRDVLMRTAEAGWDGADLVEIGHRLDRPAWVACGRVMQEYDDVTRLGETTPDRGTRYDAAGIVDEAAQVLAAWDQELPDHPRPRWRVVVHDDYQDATMATARLLEVLAADGSQVVLLGDPDTAVQTFRGALPGLLEEAERPPARHRAARDPLVDRTAGAFGATRHLLPTVWRGDERLRRVVVATTHGLPALGEAERRRSGSATADVGSSVEVAVTTSAGEEARLIAHHLRRHRLAQDVPWSGMAVLARSAGHLVGLRRGLRAAGVPVSVSRDVPLAAEPAVRPLLRLLRLLAEPDAEDAGETLAELLLSPLGGLDPVGLRILRRGLRAAQIRAVEGRAGEPVRSSDELLVDAVLAPETNLADVPVPEGARRAVERVARMLRAGRRALEAEGAADVENVLWAVWEASGRAEVWRHRAGGTGPAAERADADLDAVVALFRAAEGFVERREGGTLAQFIDLLQSEDFATDTLARTGEREAVELLTAASAAGREWDVVVVAGVQEDVWPDLRLRARLLDPVGLSDLAAGRGLEPVRVVEARRAVLWDERRLFAAAVSRTRLHLLVTAVQDAETRPSAFLDLVDPRDQLGDDVRPTVSAPGALDLRGLVARLRREVLRAVRSDQEGGRRFSAHERGVAAAGLLATLARAGVPGADPAQWWGRAASSDAPLWGPDDLVPVRPSALVTFADCALRWALESSGGRAGSSLEADLGTLVHAIAADLPEGSREELHAELDARWASLRLPDTWVGRRKRQEAEHMIDLLADYISRTPPGAAEVEVPFEVVIGRAEMVGRVDRIERTDDSGVRIVDLKTGKTPVSTKDALEHAQLTAYQAAVAAGGFGPDRHPDGARLVYLGGSSKSPVLREQPAARDDAPARFVAEAAETMASATFLATPGSACSRCPVRTSCPALPSGDRVVGR